METLPRPMLSPNQPYAFPDRKIILIGGSSHAGKSTLAQALATKLNGEALSTDRLARHPGRPWNHTGEVKPHVAAHYATLEPEELIIDVLAHYRKNVLPQVAEIVARQPDTDSPQPLVLEGSALWPEDIAQLDLPSASAFWLTASDDLFTQRIHTESRYTEASTEGRHLIDKFLARTLRYNQRMVEACHRLGLTVLNVEAHPDSAKLTQHCLSLVT